MGMYSEWKIRNSAIISEKQTANVEFVLKKIDESVENSDIGPKVNALIGTLRSTASGAKFTCVDCYSQCSGCGGGCMSGCINGCKGCNGCDGCNGSSHSSCACSGCAGNCGGNCTGGCDSGCNTVCGNSCSSTCRSVAS